MAFLPERGGDIEPTVNPGEITSNFQKRLKIIVVLLPFFLASFACVSCQTEKAGNTVAKSPSEVEKPGHFELLDKLDAKEITTLEEIVDMYGEPIEVEEVRGTENAKRYFFEFEEGKTLILHAKAPQGEITGHQIVRTYN